MLGEPVAAAAPAFWLKRSARTPSAERVYPLAGGSGSAAGCFCWQEVDCTRLRSVRQGEGQGAALGAGSLATRACSGSSGYWLPVQQCCRGGCGGGSAATAGMAAQGSEHGDSRQLAGVGQGALHRIGLLSCLHGSWRGAAQALARLCQCSDHLLGGCVCVCRRAGVRCQGWYASTGVGTCAGGCAGCAKHWRLPLQKMGFMECEHWQGLSLEHTAEAGHQGLAVWGGGASPGMVCCSRHQPAACLLSSAVLCRCLLWACASGADEMKGLTQEVQQWA